MSIGNSAKTVASVKNRGAGVLVAGRYRLASTIGSGGMGTVWLAHDLSLDADCAVKLIDDDKAADAEVRMRFEREAKVSAQLRSAHIVDVFDYGEWDGTYFIAMECLKGEDLSARLERLGGIDFETTYRIVAHVARALTHAHAQGVIHRDLKPEMYATASLAVDRKRELALPRSSLMHLGDQTMVFIELGKAPDGRIRFERRPVSVSEELGGDPPGRMQFVKLRIMFRPRPADKYKDERPERS